jgi:hypothetical protein
MSTADPTPLAQRLRQSILSAWDNDARTENISSNPDEREVTGSATEAADLALVAVLRELAGEYTDAHGQWYVVTVPRLRALADSIEKGDVDG